MTDDSNAGVSDAIPGSIGGAGLTGRTQIVRIPDSYDEPDDVGPDGEPVWSEPRAAGKAIPANCLRVLNSPLPPERGGGCNTDCPGRQRDGGCLCDIVRAANAQGIDWQFEVDPRDNAWLYIGPPLEGVEQYDPRPAPEPTEHTFVCPHCGEECVNSVGNWWCVHCGLNANDGPRPAEPLPEIVAVDPWEALQARGLNDVKLFLGHPEGPLEVEIPEAVATDPNAAVDVLALIGVAYINGVWQLIP